MNHFVLSRFAASELPSITGMLKERTFHIVWVSANYGSGNRLDRTAGCCRSVQR